MLKGNRLFDTDLLIARHKHRFIDELNTVSECRRHEVTVFASERSLSDINWCLQSRILFPVSESERRRKRDYKIGNRKQ